MRLTVTVFTSNQPRHVALIEHLAEIADVIAVQECTTVFPGVVEDFYKKTPVMQEYFQKVIEAEREIFGEPRVLQRGIRTLSLKMGDLEHMKVAWLEDALQSDYYVVFGASYIRGELCDFLTSKGAYNLHLGTSPYYRGNSCNFWAAFDRRPDYVGATIHLLTKGLDSGPILFHALPPAEAVDPFHLGMLAVRAAQCGIVQRLQSGGIRSLASVPQDAKRELRYSRKSDFTDDVARAFLDSRLTPDEVKRQLDSRDLSQFVRPYLLAL